jgi:hypothetical protein
MRKLLVLILIMLVIAGGVYLYRDQLFGPDLTALEPLGEERIAAFRQWPKEDREAYLAFLAEDDVRLHPQGFAWRHLVRQGEERRDYDPMARVLTTQRIEVPGLGTVFETDPSYGPIPTPPAVVLGPIWQSVLPEMQEAERVRIAVPPWMEAKGPGADEAPPDRLYFLEITLFSVT